MVRIEVIAPSEKVDKIIRDIGEVGIAHFIDINATKEYKYKELTEEVKSSDKEHHILQLLSRINNLMKKLGEIPYPSQPINVKEETSETLKQIEREIEELELENAKIENKIKEVTEEKSSLEHEIRQLDEGYEKAKSTLVNYGCDIATILTISKEALAPREKIKELYDKLTEIQRTLAFIDMARKMSAAELTISNEENELIKIEEDIEKIFTLQKSIKKWAPKALENTKIENIVNEVKNVVENKIEAIQKLKETKRNIPELLNKIKTLKENLNKETTVLLGGSFLKNLEETEQTFKMIDTLTLDSTEIEEVTKKIFTNAYEIRKSYEILQAADEFIELDAIKSLINKIHGGEPAEIKELLDKSQQLLASVSLNHLKTLKKALEIRYFEQRIKELADEPSKLSEARSEIARKSSSIHAYKETAEIELNIEDVKKKFRRTSRVNVFEIWVCKEDIEKAVKTIKGSCPNALTNVASEEKGDKPPTLMNNPQVAKCYEKLTAAYGLPNYHELDPTLISLLTFPVIFGLMFGDIGHGLIFLVGGLIIKPLFKKLKITEGMWTYLLQGRVLIVSCGITAIFFGFLYGEFFGPPTNPNNIFGQAWVALTGLDKPLWFNPLEVEFGGPLMLLKVALIVGMIQISFGIILDVINKFSNRQYRKALAPISWLWFYLSLCYILLTFLLTPLTLQQVILAPTTIILLVIPLIGMFVLHKLTHDFMEAFSETIVKAVESLSNTISYSRILALGIAHIIFSEIALLTGGFMFWPTFILVTLFMVLSLEGIITFAHTLRLHWVEWFSKFYGGDGVSFENFTIKRRFTTII
jgi:vacuolar-type H+-ATPase subunit I/STV1